MKRLTAIITTLGALAVPAAAHASGGHAAPCRVATPGFTQYLGALDTSCTTARTIERYFVSHELAGHPYVHVAGATWRYRHWSSTEASFIAGARVVYIVHRPSS